MDASMWRKKKAATSCNIYQMSCQTANPSFPKSSQTLATAFCPFLRANSLAREDHQWIGHSSWDASSQHDHKKLSKKTTKPPDQHHPIVMERKILHRGVATVTFILPFPTALPLSSRFWNPFKLLLFFEWCHFQQSSRSSRRSRSKFFGTRDFLWSTRIWHLPSRLALLTAEGVAISIQATGRASKSEGAKEHWSLCHVQHLGWHVSHSWSLWKSHQLHQLCSGVCSCPLSATLKDTRII